MTIFRIVKCIETNFSITFSNIYLLKSSRVFEWRQESSGSKCILNDISEGRVIWCLQLYDFSPQRHALPGREKSDTILNHFCHCQETAYPIEVHTLMQSTTTNTCINSLHFYIVIIFYCNLFYKLASYYNIWSWIKNQQTM